jgi:hypothetical protein
VVLIASAWISILAVELPKLKKRVARIEAKS